MAELTRMVGLPAGRPAASVVIADSSQLFRKYLAKPLLECVKVGCQTTD